MINTEPAPDMRAYTVAEIALNFPHAIKILNRYGLDYCCDGKKLFVTACEKAFLDADTVWNEIVDEIPYPDRNGKREFRHWGASLLIDFIVQHHHEYLRVTIPQIKDLLNTVCSVHGDTKPELLEIRFHFNTLAEELLCHLPKEENVLFPALRRLSGPGISKEIPPLLKNIKSTILVMEHEHLRTGELIRIIRKLSNDYEIPAHACPTFHLAFKLLEEFEHDVMQHIHLENNILFPKVRCQ
jgi:regulator of cell morphogenesis and NO signaling